MRLHHVGRKKKRGRREREGKKMLKSCPGVERRREAIYVVDADAASSSSIRSSTTRSRCIDFRDGKACCKERRVVSIARVKKRWRRGGRRSWQLRKQIGPLCLYRREQERRVNSVQFASTVQCANCTCSYPYEKSTSLAPLCLPVSRLVSSCSCSCSSSSFSSSLTVSLTYPFSHLHFCEWLSDVTQRKRHLFI